MPATATPERSKTDTNGSAPDRPSTREEAAERILEVLTDKTQSEAAIRRKIIGGRAHHGTTDVIRQGLAVLESQRKALRLPGGAPVGGWVRYDAKLSKDVRSPAPKIDFNYQWGEKVPIEDCFVDAEYQRPLTNFVDKIQRGFDPLLFQVLVLSDRGTKHKPKRFAIVDGQTRWAAARRLGIPHVPAIIFKNLTPEQEADMFARLQKERRAIITWHRFRAALKAKKEEALAIKSLVEAVGFEIGDRPGQIKAVGALEKCYRSNDFLLERALSTLKQAWPDVVPADRQISGMHLFFRNFPMDTEGKKQKLSAADKKKGKGEIDDELLVRRLKTTSPEGLQRAASLAREASIKGSGGWDRWTAVAIQKVYAGRS